MESLLRVLAEVHKLEDAVEDAAADTVRAQVKELRRVCHEEYLKKAEAERHRHPLEPTRRRVHDVPTPAGTPFERTFTGTWRGRALVEDSEE